MKTPRVKRPYVLGMRVSRAERAEIQQLVKATHLSVSNLLRYAFSLARDRIATVSTCAEKGDVD